MQICYLLSFFLFLLEMFRHQPDASTLEILLGRLAMHVRHGLKVNHVQMDQVEQPGVDVIQENQVYNKEIEQV